MSAQNLAGPIGHSHVFLGSGHEGNERKTWAVIALCAVMMTAEIVGGGRYQDLLPHSIAVTAFGLTAGFWISKR